MGKLNLANLKKALRYLKKNGISETFYSVKERLSSPYYKDYTYAGISKEEETSQRNLADKLGTGIKFSIAVPCYETDKVYLRELIEAVLNQTYTNWELLLADASSSDEVEKVVAGYTDKRIVYFRLSENKGIAENTNAALTRATGEYTALVDHDDLITLDALYEMAVAIEKERPIFLYSDEDKIDENRNYFEPHFKMDFNLDYLLSNNYICHLLVAKTDMLKKLSYRGEFDGAQDYDMILRLVKEALEKKLPICHISKVLYHWRCHSGSTAANPDSKLYAYEAGKKAVESFVADMGLSAKVSHAEHLGYYRVDYDPAKIWDERPSLGAIGGPVFCGNTICSGAMDENGNVLYQNMNKHASGYMNRCRMKQTVQALDVRNMTIRPEILQKFHKSDMFTTYLKVNRSEQSLLLSEFIRDMGYEMVYDPTWKEKGIEWEQVL